jgi:CubicO group peptidase (beta-lactamase class C family)
MAVTDDTVFAYGSITKVYTATMVMQLVAEGRVELDAPVATYLTGTAIDPAITVRHVLTHTANFHEHGDDVGRGDDGLEKLLAAHPFDQMLPPGSVFSYSDTSFLVLARIAEVLEEAPWEEVLRRKVLAPAGLNDTLVYPEELLTRRIAIGHLPDAKHKLHTVTAWPWPRSPAGSLCGTAADLVGFARLHTGSWPDAATIVDPGSARSMADTHIEFPQYQMTSGWGLGFAVYEWNGARMIGHDGNVYGHNAFLRLDPENDRALALLTNSTTSALMQIDFYGDVFGEVFGVEVPKQPRPLRKPVSDPERFAGAFARPDLQIEVEVRNGELVVPGCLYSNSEDVTLRAVDESTFLLRSSTFGADIPVSFMNDVDGRPSILHMAMRAYPRIPSITVDEKTLNQYAGEYNGFFDLTITQSDGRLWMTSAALRAQSPQLPERWTGVATTEHRFLSVLGEVEFVVADGAPATAVRLAGLEFPRV